jgi:hypothetical protein
MPQYKGQRLTVPTLFCFYAELIAVNSNTEAVRRDENYLYAKDLN